MRDVLSFSPLLRLSARRRKKNPRSLLQEGGKGRKRGSISSSSSPSTASRLAQVGPVSPPSPEPIPRAPIILCRW